MGAGYRYSYQPRAAALRLDRGGAVVDPNSSATVTQVGASIRFAIESGAGPHTSPAVGAAVTWPALDDMGRAITSPYLMPRIDLQVIARPSFDSGIVVEAGFCTAISPIAEYFGTGIYFPSGGVCHRRDISPGPTVSTGSIGIKMLTRSAMVALTAGQATRTLTTVRNIATSYMIANGQSYTSYLGAPNRNQANTALYYYVAAYSVDGALSGAETVVLQARQGGPNPSTWDWYDRGGERLWQIGDSITQEVQAYADQLESNRALLLEALAKRGGIQPVGHTSESSYRTWMRHSGVGGLTAALAVTNYTTYRDGLQDAPPDIVTIMLGTNDAAAAVSADDFGDSMQALVNLIAADFPSASIYVAYPTPSPVSGDDTVQQTYTAEIDALTGVDTVVDMRTGFNTGTMCESASDPHPTVLGHAFIADTWAAAITLAGEA